jgi:hypothetical protein
LFICDWHRFTNLDPRLIDWPLCWSEKTSKSLNRCSIKLYVCIRQMIMLLRLTKECRLLRGERVVDSAASHQSWPRQKFCCRRGSFHCACPTLSPSRRINDTPPGQRRVRSLLSLGYDRLGRDVKAHVFYLVRGAALSAQPPFSCSYSRVDRRDALLTAATKNCMAIIEEGIWKMHQIEAMFHLARLFDFRSFFFFP